MLKKKVASAICVAMLILMAAAPTHATDNTDNTYIEKGIRNRTIIDVEREIANLEYCEGEQSFTDPAVIDLIAKEYSLENPENIEEIRYIPILEPEEVLGMEREDPAQNEDIQASENQKSINQIKASGSTSYYVKKKGSSDSQGKLIRSSWYRYPGGSMTISEAISRTHSFSASAGIEVPVKIVKAQLEAAYGISFSKMDTVSDTQEIKVKAKHKRNASAYVNTRTYKGELWKKYMRKGDWVDTKCGNTTVKRGVGVIFVVGKNVRL
ncbi:MAG: hypothetical protein IKE52_01175 [Mogibacterium sp.]|nr:hypothetical protein [Mogibacterium sp.]